jgi:hypothetical protein
MKERKKEILSVSKEVLGVAYKPSLNLFLMKMTVLLVRSALGQALKIKIS